MAEALSTRRTAPEPSLKGRGGHRTRRLRVAVTAVLASTVGPAVGLAASAGGPAGAQTTTTLTATVSYTCSIDVASFGEVLGDVPETLTATATVPESVQAGETFAVGLAGTITLPPSVTELLGSGAIGSVTALTVVGDAAGATPATSSDSAQQLPFTVAISTSSAAIPATLAPVTLTAAAIGPVTISVGNLTASVTLDAAQGALGGVSGLSATDTCTVASPVALGSVPVGTSAPAPAVTGLSPTVGAPTGGGTVTVSGAGLTGATTVDFGSAPATAVTVAPSGASLTATAPPGTGTVAVTVTTPAGTSDPLPFTYAAVPTVTGVSPASGPGYEASLVTVTGTGFTGATAVALGSTSLPFAVLDDGHIDAAVPGGTGTAAITVTTLAGTSAATAAADFTYVPVPTITAISPSTGPVSGGTSVTITGTGLTGATSVSFGGIPATFTVDSDTQITAVSPPGEGQVEVSLSTPGGFAYSAMAFAYAPPIVELSADVTYTCAVSVPSTGGSLTGQPLGSNFSVFVPESVTAGDTLPVQPSAQFDAATLLEDLQSSLGVTSVTVDSLQLAVGASGATPATVTATVPYLPVTIGTYSENFGTETYTETQTDLWASFTMPSLTMGPTGPVVLTSGDLTAAVVLSGGTDNGDGATVSCVPTAPSTLLSLPVTSTPPDLPTVTGISPDIGPEAGGGTVTITGSGFTGAEGVYFGSQPATSFTVASDGTITAVVPADDGYTAYTGIDVPILPAVDVTVTTPGGTSAVVPADQYTYVPPPYVFQVTPGAGPPSGGSTVTISGGPFVGVTSVDFGSVPATSFTVVNANEITAVAPKGTGTVDVVVQDLGGTTPVEGAATFTYGIATPTVTRVLPDVGPGAGGGVVYIVGTNFSRATAVDFGSVPADFTVISSVVIMAVSPPGSTGAVNVTVTTPSGTSATSAADQFTYQA